MANSEGGNDMSALSLSNDAEEQHDRYQESDNMADDLKVLDYDDIEGSTKYDTLHDDEGEEEENRGVESLYTDLSCLCLPTCAKRPADICSRMGTWGLSNADQFISSVIVAISLIPESISYALIGGLPITSALQSAWIMNVITAVIGGRPGMITSASGLAALLLARLVRTDTVVAESGIMFVPYVIMFAGILQCVAAFFGLGRLVSGFPAPVVVGMVNAMAILIMALQFRYAKNFPLTQEDLDNGWSVDGTAPAAEISWNVSLFAYFGKGFEWISPGLNLGIYGAEVATAFLVCMFLPKVTTILPATLVAVLVVVAVEFGLARNFGVETPLIMDYGGAQVETPWETIFTATKYKLPSLLSWETWKLILGYGCTLFMTQFTETAISLNVVDRLDESQGPGFQVLIGQGLGNVVSGIMGGMGGSGVVSMSVLADRTFGTTCLSTFMTGLIMFIFITWGYPVVNYIPLSAVSGISVAMVCSFIQWRSMVATFTMCLPTAKRDKLPPQFNISRVDVLIMLLVTAATLIVDVATLLLFVLAVGIVVFTFLRNSRDARKQTTAEVEDDIESQDELSNQEQSNQEPIPEAALHDDERANNAYESRPWPTEDEASAIAGNVSFTESVLDAAECVIFPPRNTLS